MRAQRDRERGAAAVEFALSIPALLIVVFAGLHLGRAISARSRASDAASFAARAEAIAASGRPGGQVLPDEIKKMVTSRMNGASECSSVETTSATSGSAPYLSLTVTVTCTLKTTQIPFMKSLSLTTVSATAAMPIDYEPPN